MRQKASEMGYAPDVIIKIFFGQLQEFAGAESTNGVVAIGRPFLQEGSLAHKFSDVLDSFIAFRHMSKLILVDVYLQIT